LALRLAVGSEEDLPELPETPPSTDQETNETNDPQRLKKPSSIGNH
jgi:hypothetical protein